MTTKWDDNEMRFSYNPTSCMNVFGWLQNSNLSLQLLWSEDNCNPTSNWMKGLDQMGRMFFMRTQTEIEKPVFPKLHSKPCVNRALLMIQVVAVIVWNSWVIIIEIFPRCDSMPELDRSLPDGGWRRLCWQRGGRSSLSSPGHISWAPVKTSPALAPDLEVTSLTLEPPVSQPASHSEMWPPLGS